MKTHTLVPAVLFAALGGSPLGAFPLGGSPVGSRTSQAETTEARDFATASGDVARRLEQSLAELERLRDQLSDEKLPLVRELQGAESELSAVRKEYQEVTSDLTRQKLEASNLEGEIASREETASYLSGLLSEYMRNFASRLHIAELQRYAEAIDAARLATKNTALSEGEAFEAQLGLLARSFERVDEMLGGVRFEGTAVGPSGTVSRGTFTMLGPVALFRSSDGSLVGTVAERLDSLEPAVVPLPEPELTEAAAAAVSVGAGQFPVDPTMGAAQELAETRKSFVETLQQGGVVMIPILVLAGAALLVALAKWLALTLARKPSKKKVDRLLAAVAERDMDAAMARAREIKGPVGRMLAAGADHLNQPRKLIEEVMYERLLTTRLRVNRYLPFIAISAASAPLLGLLGTVTGIINTFELITVFGSGDVKTLSGGISEALVTTQFGLIVAIPSLLLHAFLSRKARRIVGRMESNAVAFTNQVSRTPLVAPVGRGASSGETVVPAPDPELVREQVNRILSELLGTERPDAAGRGGAAGGGDERSPAVARVER